ncbi:PEP-CTERM sorting domain-containing protein [Nostoc sp.]|uniref:PEP-CTERM sorting domain-containing protein n=1 Tax=Nostoc sp. TaxID=1180 RepID=UPI002FFD4BE1
MNPFQSNKKFQETNNKQSIAIKILGIGHSLKLVTATILSVATLQFAGSAQASTFTQTSPTSSGLLPSGVTSVGGVVLDIIGLNGVRVTSQLPANQTFIGYYNSGTPAAFNGNPGTIGIQSGFTSAVTGALGGGLKQAAIRFTLFDGDSAVGNFDYNENTLLVNGINFGNWSSVNAENTDGLGNSAAAGFSGGGFRNDTLDTGWFSINNATSLSNLFTSLVSTEKVVYQVDDASPFDNYYDFTQGINGSLVNVGQVPVVVPPTSVPEPTSLLGILAFGGVAFTSLLKRKQQPKAVART